jgi:hypothetical protein
MTSSRVHAASACGLTARVSRRKRKPRTATTPTGASPSPGLAIPMREFSFWRWHLRRTAPTGRAGSSPETRPAALATFSCAPCTPLDSRIYRHRGIPVTASSGSALRAARQQAHASGDLGVPDAPGGRGRRAPAAATDCRARAHRVRRCMASTRCQGHQPQTEARIRPRPRVSLARRTGRDRVISSKPTEHEHGCPHPADARVGVHDRPRSRSPGRAFRPTRPLTHRTACLSHPRRTSGTDTRARRRNPVCTATCSEGVSWETAGLLGFLR